MRRVHSSKVEVTAEVACGRVTGCGGCVRGVEWEVANHGPLCRSEVTTAVLCTIQLNSEDVVGDVVVDVVAGLVEKEADTGGQTLDEGQEFRPEQLDVCLNWEHLLQSIGRELEENFFLQCQQ